MLWHLCLSKNYYWLVLIETVRSLTYHTLVVKLIFNILKHTVAAVLEFEAHLSRYRKIVDSVGHDYDYWAPQCSG